MYLHTIVRIHVPSELAPCVMKPTSLQCSGRGSGCPTASISGLRGRSLPPSSSGGSQERTADVLVTLDTLTLSGAEGGPAQNEVTMFISSF